jgi:ATP-dependent 26S proteasome regulatory subunit
MMLCLAPEIDPTFERLFAYVQDDVTRKYVTAHLALSLFATDAEIGVGLRDSFSPEAPLFKFKLIEREHSTQLSTGWNSNPLRINPRIADYLQGINRLDETVGDFLRKAVHAESLPESHRDIAYKILRLIEANGDKSPLPLLNFVGSTRKCKRDVAAWICKELGIKLYTLDIKELQNTGAKWQDVGPVLERESLLLPMALFVDSAELEDGNDPMKLLLDHFVENVSTFCIIGSKEPLSSERGLVILDIPKLNRSEQSIIWKQQLGKNGICLGGEVDAIIEQFDFESDMIVKAITTARNEAYMVARNTSTLAVNDIWTACREQSQNGLSNLAQQIEPCYMWDDIVLPKEPFEQLKDIAAQVGQRALVYEKWGFGTKINRGRGISALFSGPSGTGKTMAAEILANHLKLDLYRIDLSAVVSKYIGETEKNLRKVFDAAEQSGSILFFDEADALFGKRSEVKDSHDRYANIEVNYLLQRMEDYRGLAVLATNMKSLLDEAFLRRLRFHVEFPLPDVEHRKKIWHKVFPPQVPVGNLDYGFLVRLEIPGGNIRNIALNTAFLAANDGKRIEMPHVLLATKREYAKIGKMVLESEFGPYYERMRQ